ncbi:hypothetical protein FSDG_01095 [Fusobacterium animalis 7_1]|uniref:Uncharacterized protein n=1 Tax=Fusobacterium animalis 7_1 TaxID=457405 RepID=A0A140PTT8_9FUSO|nr:MULTISPECIES: hypothetical protein [Fusobacterium]EEO42536.1 hypothetical protein FSDG_01095 [Fusobacterium animalis 7_1]EEW95551.2 hypothetical protein HMPREF0406_00973 [Fusobacterium animalis 3_1_33]EPC07868.1 hypothetical protein HMPREF9369_02676 [Fusobacterium polymorphum F0401]
MEVIYDVFIEDDEERFNNSPQKIEIIFSKLMKKEKELLEKYSFKYEYVEKNKVKIKDENFIYCTVEIDGQNKGIFLEKTKTYYEYFKYDYFFKKSEKTENLVISKEGIRIEIIFDKMNGEKNE